jgi:hypothetical protein
MELMLSLFINLFKLPSKADASVNDPWFWIGRVVSLLVAITRVLFVGGCVAWGAQFLRGAASAAGARVGCNA